MCNSVSIYSGMAQSSLEIIEKWKQKSSELSIHREDELFTAVTSGFEAMAAMINKESEFEDVQLDLDYLKFEKSQAIKLEKLKDNSTRDLIHGLLESLHLTLTELTEERNRLKEIVESFPQGDGFNYSMHPMEQIDVTPVGVDDNQIPAFDFEEEVSKFNKAVIDDDPTIDQLSFADEKEEVLDDESSDIHGPNLGDHSTLNDDSLRMDGTNETSMPEDRTGKDESMSHVDDNDLMDSAEKPEVERRRLPRRASKNLKYTDPAEDSDKDSSPQRKKSRSDSEEKEDDEDKKRRSKKDSDRSKSVKSRVSMRNDTELECPECEYRTVSVRGWVAHLCRQHSTTPKLAGLALRCDCGHESFSDSHIYSCNVANFTVISASDMVTPAKGSDTEMECPECEVFSKNSVRYWLVHLRRQHSTTPALAGLALRCACGHESFSENHNNVCKVANFTVIRKSDMPSLYSSKFISKAGVALRCECGHESFSENHNNVCKIAKFTVIRKCDMTTPTTPKCLVSECEKHPKTVNGYIAHVQANHNSTLKSSGFYILCACGDKMTSIGSKVNVEHSKKCNGRDFTIHKAEEE